MKTCFRDDLHASEITSNPAWKKSPSRRLLNTIYAHFLHIGSAPTTDSSTNPLHRAGFHRAMKSFITGKLTHSSQSGSDTTVVWATKQGEQFIRFSSNLAIEVRFQREGRIRSRADAQSPLSARIRMRNGQSSIMSEQNLAWDPLLSDVQDKFNVWMCSDFNKQTKSLLNVVLGKVILFSMIQGLLNRFPGSPPTGYSKATGKEALDYYVGGGLQLKHLFSSLKKAQQYLKNHLKSSFSWKLVNQHSNLDSVEAMLATHKLEAWNFVLGGWDMSFYETALNHLKAGEILPDAVRAGLLSYEGADQACTMLDDLKTNALATCHREMVTQSFTLQKVTSVLLAIIAQARMEFVKNILPVYQATNRADIEDATFRFKSWLSAVTHVDHRTTAVPSWKSARTFPSYDAV